jgi:hypothetical protein
MLKQDQLKDGEVDVVVDRRSTEVWEHVIRDMLMVM